MPTKGACSVAAVLPIGSNTMRAVITIATTATIRPSTGRSIRSGRTTGELSVPSVLGAGTRAPSMVDVRKGGCCVWFVPHVWSSGAAPAQFYDAPRCQRTDQALAQFDVITV